MDLPSALPVDYRVTCRSYRLLPGTTAPFLRRCRSPACSCWNLPLLRWCLGDCLLPAAGAYRLDTFTVLPDVLRCGCMDTWLRSYLFGGCVAVLDAGLPLRWVSAWMGACWWNGALYAARHLPVVLMPACGTLTAADTVITCGTDAAFDRYVLCVIPGFPMRCVPDCADAMTVLNSVADDLNITIPA